MMKFFVAAACLAVMLGGYSVNAQGEMVKMCLFYDTPSGHARSDPIINQQCASGHVHTFYGPLDFHPNTTYEDLLSTPPGFSTSPVIENKSLYWHPTIYEVIDNGDGTQTFTRAIDLYTSPYYRWDNSVEPKTEEFPPGFRMIAASNDPGADQGGEFGGNMFTECCTDGQACLTWNSLEFPTQTCGFLGIAFAMPTCWDGVELGNNNNHKDHMAYTLDGSVAGECPDGFNRRLPQVQLFVRINNYKGGKYQLSDSSPFWHVDFFNGWEEGKMAELIRDCPVPDQEVGNYNPPCGCTPREGNNDFLTWNFDLAKEVCDSDVRRLIINEAIDVTDTLPLGTCQGPELIPKSWDQLSEDIFQSECSPTASPTLSPTVSSPTAAPSPAGPCSGGENVRVEIVHDDYDESSWELIDKTDSVVVASGVVGEGDTNDVFCLDNGEYTFTIYDAFGDGICCAYGDGFYAVTGAISGLLASGGEFEQSESTDFTIGATDNPPTVSPTSSPSATQSTVPSSAPSLAPDPPTPAPSVTPIITFAPTTPGSEVSYLGCGNPGGRRCGGDISKFASHSESHPFRCCSETKIGSGWLKRPNCDIYAESLLPCEAANHDASSSICANVGARLCTKEEYEGKCTRGTGCNYDKELLWSSTKAYFTGFTRVTFDDFEAPNRWGNFIDGGSGVWLYTKSVANGGNDDYRNGTGSALIRNKLGGDSSIFSRDLLSQVSFFGEIRVKFWAYVFSFEGNEDFFLEYTLDGTNWIVGAQYINNENIANNEPKDFEVVLSDPSGAPLTLPTASAFQIRFRCDASGNGDVVYIDDIEISGRLI